jgi:glycosyltransferase involved in cell wall biosynthesis
MVKLLMLCYNRVGRGTYWRALGFAKELVHLQYEVTLLAIDPQRKRGFTSQDVNGVNIVTTPDLLPNSGYDVWDGLNRTAWLRKRPFDLIHAFETRPVNILPALYLQKRQHIPLITDWCDWFGRGGSVEQRQNQLLKTILRPIETFFEEYFRPRANGTTVINHVLQQKALKLGIPAQNLLYLPNGTNVLDFIPQTRQNTRQRLGISQDLFLLGYTGTMFREDAALMSAAFDLIHAQHPHVRLLLIGYSNVAVEEMVRDKTAVIRTGPITFQQLTEYVAACDAGWLPLANNGGNQGRFPMKVNDFMAAGLPLLVSDVGDLGDFVRQRQVGWAAKAEPSAMSELVCRQLAAPDFDETGRRARHIAETELAWPVVTEKLARFYARAAGGG